MNPPSLKLWRSKEEIMKQSAFLYHPSMIGTAKKLRERISAEREDRPAYKSPLYFGDISWEKFADGWPDLFLQKPVKDQDVIFLASFDNTATIFEQLAIIEAIPRYQAKSLNVIIPYFPGTMDRVDEEGQIATAKTLARLLSCTPLTKSGPAIITIFDIHALQERFYFGDQVIPDLRTATGLLDRWMRRSGLWANQKNVAIVFPDDGAYKRFHRLFPGYDKIICNKVREGDDRIVKIKEGDPRGKICVIVDDLIMKGGTTIECRNALKKAKAKKVIVFAPHGVCPDESWRKLTAKLFDKVLITDSCPKTAEAVKNLKHFEVLTIADLIYDMAMESAK